MAHSPARDGAEDHTGSNEPARELKDVSGTRLYIGNLPRNATKADVENFFNTHGNTEIAEIKLMNGFGFIEFKNSADARDVVPVFHGSAFMGERLIVQFARGSNNNNRGREDQFNAPRQAPRPRRTVHRMTITGLPFETSWQDLKDFARNDGLDVVYSEVSRDRDADGVGKGYVEYETAENLTNAVERLNGAQFKNSTLTCIADTQSEVPRAREQPRFRSRSPGYRGGGGRGGYGGHPRDDYHDRYYDQPPRGYHRGGYTPPRDDYRRRSPPPRGGYYDDHRDDRYGPPRRGGPPMDDYGPPPRGGRYPPDDRYGAPAPPPQRGYDDPYKGGHGREPYGRPPSPGPPRRDNRDYGRGGYEPRPYQ